MISYLMKYPVQSCISNAYVIGLQTDRQGKFKKQLRFFKQRGFLLFIFYNIF